MQCPSIKKQTIAALVFGASGFGLWVAGVSIDSQLETRSAQACTVIGSILASLG